MTYPGDGDVVGVTDIDRTGFGGLVAGPISLAKAVQSQPSPLCDLEQRAGRKVYID